MPVLRFTADKHHGHKRIIEFENRPFKTVEIMNEKLIAYHNEMVKEDDLTVDFGDFFFRGGYQATKNHYWDYLNQYNGRYVIVRGNHEGSNKILDPFQKVMFYLSGVNVLGLHDPINADTTYDLILHGHMHSSMFISELHEKKKVSLCINVGIDCWNYRPVEWQKLYDIYCQWKNKKIKVPIFDKEKVKKIREERRKR